MRLSSLRRNFIPVVSYKASLGTLKLRSIASPGELRREIIDKAQKQGWNPGAFDHEHYFALDNSGFYVGELNGSTVSTFSATKWSKTIAHLGSLMVENQYQGQGYGRRTFELGLSTLSNECILAGNAVPKQVEFYKEYGMKPYWKLLRFEFSARDGQHALTNQYHHSRSYVISATTTILPKVLKYDATITALKRYSFLKEWIFAPNSFCSVATDDAGEITGYGVIRKNLFTGDGWSIGPLYADNVTVASKIIEHICKKLAPKIPLARIVIDIPDEEYFDNEARHLVCGCNGTHTGTFFRIYKGGVPINMQLKKIVGQTSMTVGY